MFFKELEKGKYLYTQDDLLKENDFSEVDRIALPLVIDTEFFTNGFNKKRTGLTVQMSSIFADKGEIYLHPDFVNYCKKNGLTPRKKHKIIKHDFAVFDYLENNFLGIKIQEIDWENYNFISKTLTIDLYAHFAIAELLMCVNNSLKDYFKKIIKSSGKKNKSLGEKIKDTAYYSHINFTRRLALSTRLYNGQQLNNNDGNSIAIPYRIKINGDWYKVRVRYIDTFGLHGVSSYKDLASSVGLELKFKDNLSQWEKENMDQTYFDNPIKFDEYSLGDLEIYKILVNNNDLSKSIYTKLGIKEYYQSPELTMGSTSENIFTSKLMDYFNILPNDKKAIEKLEQYCSYGSSSILKQEIKNTSCLLSKVFGGRCRNNRPLDHFIESLLADIDIDGCYGNALRLQIYPIGKPIIESYDFSGKNNKFKTLREWLKERCYNTPNNELVYGLWHCIIDSKQELKYSQDFLSSWFNFKIKDLKNLTPLQDDETEEINPKEGITKIFKNEIKNGVINDDFLDWLFFVANKNQRTELLDNLIVKSAIYYPKNKEVNTLDELEENLKDDDVEQETIEGITRETTNHNSAWIGINLGELLIDDLLASRQLYSKKKATEKPLNTLYKLIINSLYGVFCSPFFKVSSCVVGNNITARARFMCYLMEKGLNGFQSITDGCVFELNKVSYPDRIKYLSATNFIDLYRYSDKEKINKKHIILKPLDNAEFIYFDGRNAVIYYSRNNYLLLNKDEFKIWINEKTMQHLQQVFDPKIRVLNQQTTKIKLDENKVRYFTNLKGMYELEVKDIYKASSFHGSGNYYLIGYDEKDNKIAFRSYQNRKHQSYNLIENELNKSEFYEEISPCLFFISQLKNRIIKRGKVFLKKGILKINEYSNNYEKYDKLGLSVGDNVLNSGLLREFSQSQFTFLTIEQFKNIDREIQGNKRRYNQSYEGYFVNDNNELDYYLMMEVIEKAIYSGVSSINKYLDISDNRLRDKPIKHSELACLESVKELVKTNSNELDNFDFNISDEDQINAIIEEMDQEGIEINFDLVL